MKKTLNELLIFEEKEGVWKFPYSHCSEYDFVALEGELVGYKRIYVGHGVSALTRTPVTLEKVVWLANLAIKSAP